MIPEHWSATRERMIGRCGEQYRRRYGEGEKLPPGIAMIRGSAVHKANELHMRAKMDGEPWSLEATKDEAVTAFDQRLREGYVVDGSYAKMGFEPKEAIAHARGDVLALSALHFVRVAPKIEPTAAEVRIEIPASDSLPVPFVSILDVIDRDESPIDTKTAAKKPSKEDAHDSDQLSGQALAFRALKKKPEKNLRLDVLVRTTVKRNEDYVPLVTKRTEEDLAGFVGRVRQSLLVVEGERWLPAPEGSWACAPLWCGYWPTCPYARGKNRPKS